MIGFICGLVSSGLSSLRGLVKTWVRHTFFVDRMPTEEEAGIVCPSIPLVKVGLITSSRILHVALTRRNAESVGKFQPRVCFETLGTKMP